MGMSLWITPETSAGIRGRLAPESEGERNPQIEPPLNSRALSTTVARTRLPRIAAAMLALNSITE